MPKAVLNCTLVPSQGKYSFDPVSKVLQWDVGKIDVTKLPNIRGTVYFCFKLALYLSYSCIYMSRNLFL